MLASIHEENILLLLELGDTKGFDGGCDLRIVDDTGLKIDGAIVISAVSYSKRKRKFYVSADFGSGNFWLNSASHFLRGIQNSVVVAIGFSTRICKLQLGWVLYLWVEYFLHLCGAGSYIFSLVVA